MRHEIVLSGHGVRLVPLAPHHAAGLFDFVDAGMWAGMTLYPESKCSPPRAVDMLEVYGHERVWMNCACDWGVSDPLAVPKTALEMKKRGHTAEAIDKVIFQNPQKFLSQSPRFRIKA